MGVAEHPEGSPPQTKGRILFDRKTRSDFLTSGAWSPKKSALFITAASILGWAILLFLSYKLTK